MRANKSNTLTSGTSAEERKTSRTRFHCVFIAPSSQDQRSAAAAVAPHLDCRPSMNTRVRLHGATRHTVLVTETYQTLTVGNKGL